MYLLFFKKILYQKVGQCLENKDVCESYRGQLEWYVIGQIRDSLSIKKLTNDNVSWYNY